MLGYLSLDDFYSMRNGWQYNLKAFPDCLGAAWQVDNEAPASDAGGGSTQHRHWRGVEGSGSHCLNKTGCDLIYYGEGRFRGDVALA